MSATSFRVMIHDEIDSEWVSFEAAMRYVRTIPISDDPENNRSLRILKVEVSVAWRYCQGCEDC